MKQFAFILLLFSGVFSQTQTHKVTPSVVFGEVKKIYAETHLLKEHFKLNKKHTEYKVEGNLKPRHVWQLAYMINVKINLLRLKHNLPRVEEVAIAPVKKVDPFLPYGMTQRLLTEISIFKKALGIKTTIKPVRKYSNKKPIDVFNELLEVSSELDILNEGSINPSIVFAQVMRLIKDVDLVYGHLNIQDRTIPPQKSFNSEPRDAFLVAYKIVENIQKLQKKLNIENVDFSSFTKKEEILPEDTFIMVAISIAELQVVKAYMGIVDKTTPPAQIFRGKNPSDVEQLLGWVNKKILNIKLD